MAIYMYVMYRSQKDIANACTLCNITYGEKLLYTPVDTLN